MNSVYHTIIILLFLFNLFRQNRSLLKANYVFDGYFHFMDRVFQPWISISAIISFSFIVHHYMKTTNNKLRTLQNKKCIDHRFFGSNRAS